MYGLLTKVNKHHSCNPKLLFDLFDKMIMPIALYNSEIWGTMCFPTNPNNNDFLGDLGKKNLVDDLQKRFCKRVLMVNDRSTNWAAVSECGRTPTIPIIISRMASFWLHLIQTSSPILKAALQTYINLASTGFRSWFSFLHRCFRTLNIDHILYTSDFSEISSQIKKVKKLLHDMAIMKWSSQLTEKTQVENSKINLFCQLKTNLSLSPHLTAPITPKSRAAITKFRMSAHNLPSETGRYAEIPRVDRLCPLCSGGIENEEHYITECTFETLIPMRSKLYHVASNCEPTFSTLSNTNKTLYLLQCLNPILIPKIGKFTAAIIDIFKEINTGARSE
jgi:hypothetical protein